MHLTKISVVYEVAVVVADDVRMHNLKIKIILVRSLPIRSLVDSALRKTKKKKSKYTCIITQCILKVAPPHLSYLCTARVPRLASPRLASPRLARRLSPAAFVVRASVLDSAGREWGKASLFFSDGLFSPPPLRTTLKYN